MPESKNAPTGSADASRPASTSEAPDLVDRAQKAERERDEYFDLLKRSQAEFENIHQRFRRERDQERQYAAGPLAKDLLGALDNLERALMSAHEAGDNSPLAQGVALVHDQILDALKRHGISVIEALHKPFDPHFHQALSRAPSDEHPADTVIDVPQQGYVIHGRVLRPASVIVSTPATSNAPPNST